MSQNNQLTQKTDSWYQLCKNVLSEQTNSLTALKTNVESTEEFIRFLHKHGLEVLLLDLLEQQNRPDLLPDFIIEKLIELRRLAYIKEVYRKQHLSNLLQTLKSNQIDCLILKGTALAYSLYAKPYQRSRIDTDLFIRFKDKDLIDKLLMDCGFTKSMNVSGDFISHQNTYWRDENGIRHSYDIHWKISNRNVYADRFNFDRLFTEKKCLAELDSAAFGLAPCDAFLHATVHYFGHRSDERDRLIWIYDLHLLCGYFSDSDWNSLLKNSQQKGLEPLVNQILQICNNHLKSRFPEQILHQLEKTQTELTKIEAKRINSTHWSRIDQFKSDWSILSFKQRCQLIKENLFPPGEFILKQSNSTNKLMLPYFYLRRIINGGLKILNKKS